MRVPPGLLFATFMATALVEYPSPPNYPEDACPMCAAKVVNDDRSCSTEFPITGRIL